MIVYSVALALALVVSAPVWLWRMARSGRYRAGLGERLGRISPALAAAVSGRQVVWLHAVSVGEVFAATRLVKELSEALGDRWRIVISTTTAAGQKVAQERFGKDRVFYFPLDFAWIVRRYLRLLQPKLVVLMESELWPRLVVECERSSIPVAVANARISDRSFDRALKVRAAWYWMGSRIVLWLAQSEETAARLVRLGVAASRIEAVGNLKFDLRAVSANAVAEWVSQIAGGRPVIVAGSTLPAKADALSEEAMILQAWQGELRRELGAVLVLAPRHTDRFDEVAEMASEFGSVRASALRDRAREGVEVIVLDTIGDLASVYGVADVAFVGGSLVARGGHNPLEAARFGVPVVMGPSYENFREMVDGMRAADAIRITDAAGLEQALLEELQDKAMGERGRVYFESQAGATKKTVDALLELVK